MSSFAISSRRLNTKKSGTKRKTSKEDRSKSLLLPKERNNSSKTKTHKDVTKSNEKLIDKKFAEYLDRLERDEIENSFNKRPIWNSSSQKKKPAKETTQLTIKPKFRKKKVVKKSKSRNSSVSSRSNSRLFESENSSLNSSFSSQKRRAPSAQQSYGVIARKRAQKNIEEANSFLLALSESSSESSQLSSKRLRNPFVVPPKKAKKSVVNDSEMYSSEHSRLNKSLEGINKQRKMNREILSKIEDSSSSEFFEPKETKKQSPKLVISQPFEYATSDALSEEIDQLKSLIEELKALNKALISKNSPQEQKAADDNDSYVSKSSHYQSESSDSEDSEDFPPPKKESPKPVRKNETAINTETPPKQAISVLDMSSPSSSFDEKERFSSMNEVKFSDPFLKALLSAEEEEDEMESAEDLASKIKAHLRNSPYSKGKITSSTTVSSNSEGEENNLTNSGKILWSAAEDDKIEPLYTSSESQEQQTKLINDPDYEEDEEEDPISIRMKNIQKLLNEKKEEWKISSDSSSEEEDNAKNTSKQSQDLPHVTIIRERHSSDDESQRTSSFTSSSILSNEGQARTFTLLSDSSDEEENEEEEIPKPKFAETKKKNAHLTPEQWMKFFSESDESDDNFLNAPRTTQTKEEPKKTKKDENILNVKEETEEEDSDFDDEEIRKFINENMRHFSSSSNSSKVESD